MAGRVFQDVADLLHGQRAALLWLAVGVVALALVLPDRLVASAAFSFGVTLGLLALLGELFGTAPGTGREAAAGQARRSGIDRGRRLVMPLRTGTVAHRDVPGIAPGADMPAGAPGARAVAATQDVLDALPVAFLRMDRDGNILSANRKARELLGHPMNGAVNFAALVDGLGRPARDWLADAADGRGLRKAEMLRAVRAAPERFLQVTLDRDGSGAATGLSAVLTDATELRALQDQFVQSQKMQAIGQLAGGIAHDFNNLLTAISGHCDLLLLRRDATDPDYADLQQIHQNANRAASLVAQLLAFSRKQTLRPQRLDLRDALGDLAHLLGRLTGERVRLTLLQEQGLSPIRADRRQIEQVIMNLVVNARDAMDGVGDIRIETVNLHLATPLRRDRATVPAGRYVEVRVIDTGCGIPPERLTKVFEPFFTTKRPGEGTGLGLSTVYGIVKQSGGFIFVDSTPGEGSCFTLLFPALRQERVPAALAPPETGESSGPRATGQSAVVLLVEDEAPVRAFAARALRLCGYRVMEAESGEQALELLEDPGFEVDIFVSDVVMTGLSGPEWVRRARAGRPLVPALFISGYAEDALAAEAAAAGEVGAGILSKPFSLSALTGAVAARLQSVSGAAAGDPG